MAIVIAEQENFEPDDPIAGPLAAEVTEDQITTRRGEPGGHSVLDRASATCMGPRC